VFLLYIKPTEIVDRTSGVLEGDTKTIELAVELFEALSNQCTTNPDHVKVPHLILCHLKRVKIDANRGIADATNRQNIADEAWYEYHNFIEIAKRK
jgi:hypothetical protein